MASTNSRPLVSRRELLALVVVGISGVIWDSGVEFSKGSAEGVPLAGPPLLPHSNGPFPPCMVPGCPLAARWMIRGDYYCDDHIGEARDCVGIPPAERAGYSWLTRCGDEKAWKG